MASNVRHSCSEMELICCIVYFVAVKDGFPAPPLNKTFNPRTGKGKILGIADSRPVDRGGKGMSHPSCPRQSTMRTRTNYVLFIYSFLG